jgi:acyl carrier protein
MLCAGQRMGEANGQVIDGVRQSIADALKVPLDDVRLDSVLTEDLDAVSIDFVDIMFRLESKFGITFHPGNPLDRIAQRFAPGALYRDGALTELGAEVLRRRMPEIDGTRVVAGTLLGNVQSLYTTATWVRAVAELLEARPRACPGCGGGELEPLRPSVVRCRRCDREIRCPTQADVLLDWAERNYPAR